MITLYFDRSPHASSSGVIIDELDAELLERGRHLIADAHDIAQVRLGFTVTSSVLTATCGALNTWRRVVCGYSTTW